MSAGVGDGGVCGPVVCVPCSVGPKGPCARMCAAAQRCGNLAGVARMAFERRTEALVLAWAIKHLNHLPCCWRAHSGGGPAGGRAAAAAAAGVHQGGAAAAGGRGGAAQSVSAQRGVRAGLPACGVQAHGVAQPLPPLGWNNAWCCAVPSRVHTSPPTDARSNAPTPRHRRHQISLYAHITGLAFALDTIDAPVHKATISDPSGSHELRALTIDSSGRTPFETANEIWSLL